MNQTLNTVHKCDDKCQNCTLESAQNNLCISCNNANGYYPLFNDTENKYPFINCYNITPYGYYLLNNEYVKDKRCDKFEEWNFNLNNSNNNSNLSYYYCPLYYYCDSSNNFYCTINNECPENYPMLIEAKHKCIENCTIDPLYKYEYQNNCFDSCPNGTNISTNNHYLCEDIFVNIKECSPADLFLGKCKINNITINMNNMNLNISTNSPEVKDEIIKNIKEGITNGDMDELIDDVVTKEKKDLVISDNNTIFQITSTENQKNQKNNNISTLILGECENILKRIYGIQNDLALLIFKIDYYQPGSLVPVIGYEVYHPLNKSKLDLNYCKNASVNFNIPVSINENFLFKYDPEHEYYKDNCIPSTSEDGTDIILNDRQNEFNNKNMSLCESECTFTEYESESKLANCKCGIKNKEFVISELINQADILSHNFTSKQESSNILTMKCYYTLFTKEGLEKNIGSYLLLITIFLFIFLGILFYKCGYPLLEQTIKEIIRDKEKNEERNIERKKTTGERIIKRSKTKKTSSRKMHSERSDSRKSSLRKSNKNVKDDIKSCPNEKKKKKVKIKKSKNHKGNIELNLKNTKTLHLDNNSKSNSNSLVHLQYKNTINIVTPKKDQIIESTNLSESYDYDLNIMSYSEALKYDKRTFWDYYCSLIKSNNYIIFAFCPNKDYNSTLIKISLFMFYISVFYFINALFFDEKTIHKIYEEAGYYNFIYLVPHIFCSFAISHTINTVIKYIFLSERNIYEIKYGKDSDWDKTDKIKKCIIIKYICFFCIGTLCLIFFWYYLSSFGAVYRNTQIYLVKNFAISFAVVLIYPFIFSIIIAMLRIGALKGKNNECMYKVSRFLQFI